MTQATNDTLHVDIQELKSILVGFITEQRTVNAEQKTFNTEVSGFIAEQKTVNAEQKTFNTEVSGFIAEQKTFNTEVSGFIAEQKTVNAEQKAFNDKIDKKIDKVQYFLEESLAENTKMFFEEQIEMKSTIKELDDDVYELRNNVIALTSQVKTFLAG